MPATLVARSSLSYGPRVRSRPSYPQTSKSRRRCYGTRQTASNGPFACSWLTRTPEKISPDDVLASLPALPFTITDHMPVLLVTPRFASWIDQSGPIVDQWMNRIYRDNKTTGPLYAVAAVIDKLPDTRVDQSFEPENGVEVNPSETEGLSLLFANPENVQAKPAPPSRVRQTDVEEPALVFSIQTGQSSPSERSIHQVGLRLANTIFVNGNENTMVGMRWARESASNDFELQESKDLSTCIIATTAGTVHNHFDLPLHPVTQRRKVVSSMGNILRQITGSNDEPNPASSELEKELPRYIAENNIVDQLVPVWALIEKPGVNSVEGDTQERLASSLRMGGKLYRVMSGGGGWGKKQGLLSLDPDVSLSEATGQDGIVNVDHVFRPRADSLDLPPSLKKQLVIDDLNLLSQAASQGDSVQFFVSVDPSRPQDRSFKAWQQEQDSLYHFGVVLYAEDEFVAPGETHQKDLVILPNYFGALSAKTINYSQPIAGPKVMESSTKVDIPGCRVGLHLNK